MKYRKVTHKNKLELYKQYYKDISGGIDGYYEKTIMEAIDYEVYDKEVDAYFTIHHERGLTSLLVLDKRKYEQIFNFVIELPIVNKILFTQNDTYFLDNIERKQINYQKQAINFEISSHIESPISMKKVEKEDVERIYNQFTEFIEYNNTAIDKIKSFYHELDGEIVSLGALEPMMLNDKRYCIVMIVNEKFRGKGYGKSTVQFLINYLQNNNLEVNARCYILNEASKKTILSSGMEISNYLFRVDEV